MEIEQNKNCAHNLFMVPDNVVDTSSRAAVAGNGSINNPKVKYGSYLFRKIHENKSFTGFFFDSMR